MRFAILNTDYPEFLRCLYPESSGLPHAPYEEQLQARNESLFGVADFYSCNLRQSGHEAQDIYANNEHMQKAWAREHRVLIEEPTPIGQYARTSFQRLRAMSARPPIRFLKRVFRPVLRSLNRQPRWFYQILAAQISHYKPDVLLNQAMDGISSLFLKEMKPQVRLLVGQHAAGRLPDSEDFSSYDLVLSSFPPTVERFGRIPVRAELNRLGFEPRILSSLRNEEKSFPVAFIGSLSRDVHNSRVALLEALCARFPDMRIWGPGVDHLASASPIRRCFAGQAWGRQMYQILRDSKITLNHHGDIAPHANNCRLYEATGVGTLLVTDWKADLQEIFEPGKEVVAYRTPGECAELITYYLQHDEERDAIARAGQQRTLREHTYYQRTRELVDIVRKCL